MRCQASLLAAAATLLLAPAALAPSDAGRLAGIGRGLGHREYHASPNHIGLQAPNRAQNLRTYFEPTGIRVHGRTAPSELLSLSLAGMGRGDDLAPLPPGEVSSQGARVEIRRDGFVEWYENSAAGLEQGFTLAARPAGEGPLVVELALRGAQASQGEEAVFFSAGSGRRLRYDGLVAIDASGRELFARLSVPDPERVRIEVEDAGAAYPLVIDPLLTNTADSVLDTNYANSGLSFVTSIGDVNGDGYDDVMVGTHQGFAFLGSASGIASAGLETAATVLWGRAESYKNMAGAGDVNGDGYDDVIMGFGFAGSGYAELWMGSPSGIVTSSHDDIFSGLMSDGYTYGGISTVAGAGDVNGDGYDDVILTTWRWNAPYSQRGVAAVFHGSAAGISGYLGSADTLIAFPSAHAINCAGAGDVNGDGYDDVILGIRENGDPRIPNSGAAMVFHGSASGIASGDHADTLLAAEEFSFGDFGNSVAGAGDVNGDGFDDVIVGGAYLGGGAAIVYLGSASGIPDSLSYWSPTASVIEPDLATIGMGYFAWSVAGAGDVNGDGYDDVIVGAPYAAAGQDREGAAFLFLGSETGIAAGTSDGAYARLESNQAITYFGGDVAGAGDVNGDGLADVITAGELYAAGEENEGAALLYLGEADVDRDRAPDAADNCRAVVNATQIDADDDGFGNHCDADFDQNGASGLTDFGTFRYCYGRTVPVDGGPSADPTCAESDMDGDGAVGPLDYGLFRSEFGTPPGP